jgi:hypothetical protein
MEEIWKDIPGYEGLYQASNLGKIRGKRGLLKLSNSHKRYYYAQLTINGKNKSKSVHRLVALTFLGFSKLDVDHINGDKFDNRACNLRYLTARDNCLNKKNVKGYHYCKFTNKWKSEIRINNKKIWLGRFNTEQEALDAYNKAKMSATNKHLYGY